MYFIVNLPVIKEEAILDQNVDKEIDEAFSRHAKQVLPNEVPVVRVWTIVFT